MDQQTKFKTALAALAASAETKDRKLTKADVKEFLEDMDLGEEQMKLVYAYLASINFPELSSYCTALSGRSNDKRCESTGVNY